jgi:CRP-like cAMP-binding protein
MTLREADSLANGMDAHGAIPSVPQWRCEMCRSRSSGFCDALLERSGRLASMRGRHRQIAARQNIYRAGELNEGVLVICAGWAVRFVQLPNGKRQILAVMLPGDLASPTSMLEGQLGFSIQAVTDVRYCHFPIAEVRACIRNNPALFDAWLRLTAAEQRDADRRLVDLGQRTAEERIAALIVHVMQRCEQRGELVEDEFPFPLSQQQIADFTGLTPVHTCRVLSSLRKNAVCTLGRGFAKVTQRRELQRMAALK